MGKNSTSTKKLTALGKKYSGKLDVPRIVEKQITKLNQKLDKERPLNVEGLFKSQKQQEKIIRLRMKKELQKIVPQVLKKNTNLDRFSVDALASNIIAYIK
jgi:hypothetical protein